MRNYLKHLLLNTKTSPPFKSVPIEYLSDHQLNAIHGPVRLIPLLQKHPLSDDLRAAMRHFSRKPDFTVADRRKLTECVLLEALRIEKDRFGSDCGLVQNY